MTASSSMASQTRRTQAGPSVPGAEYRGYASWGYHHRWRTSPNDPSWGLGRGTGSRERPPPPQRGRNLSMPYGAGYAKRRNQHSDVRKHPFPQVSVHACDCYIQPWILLVNHTPTCGNAQM